MKNLIFLLVIGFVLSSCALEQASPSDYTDAFYREQMKIKEKINLLAKTNDYSRQKEIVEELKVQSTESYQKIMDVGAFRGDDQLFKAAKQLFEFYKRMAHEGLDTEAENISRQLDQWRQVLADEEHEFLRAQGKFAENYELFL